MTAARVASDALTLAILNATSKRFEAALLGDEPTRV